MSDSSDTTPGDRQEVAAWHDSRSPLYAPKRRGFQVREETIVQIGRGELAVDARMCKIQDISLVKVGVGVESIGVTVLDPSYVAFALPVSWSGEFLVNGMPASASDLFMPGDLDSFHLRSKRRVTIGVIIPRLAFAETIAALRGVSVDEIKLNDRTLHMDRAAGARVRVRITAILDEVCSGALQRTAREISEEVLGQMADAYLSGKPEPERRAERPDRIVRLAEECFMAAAGKSVSLADLCAAAGVGKSTLYLAFHRVCGESPLAYFRKRQLTQVRTALVWSEPVRGRITQAALDAGLTELGRFAAEYRRLFGELPSATLTRPQSNYRVR